MLVKCLSLILIVSSIAGCATSGNYCDLSKILRPSRSDQLTEGTKRQIVEHNLKYEKFCGAEK